MQILRAPIAAVATVLVALGALVAPSAALADTVPTASTTAVPAATTTPGASVTIAPVGQGVLRPGQDLQLSVSVTNRTADALPASTASLSLIRSVLGDRDDLSDWIDDTSTDGYTGVAVASIGVPAVPAHHTVTVDSITVPAATLGLQYSTSFGARRIALDYDAGGVHAVGRSVVTWYPASVTAAPTDVAVAMPITVPATSSLLLSAATLAADTAVDGTLTQQLDAAEGHNVAIGIDPRIIASIRILGVNAPDSATAWLERLEATRNETFALSWADSDVTGLRQAGASGILTPISLDAEIAAAKANFPGATTPTPTPSATTGRGSARATTTPTPTATATERTGTQGQDGQGTDSQQGQEPGGDATAPTTLPTTQSLLDFPYTLTGIAWPTEDTVATDDLPALTSAGATHAIVSNANTTAGAEATVGASAKIGSDSVLVSDQAMSDLLRRAATAPDQDTWQAAMAELAATLATTTREGTTASPLLLTLGRSWPANAARLTQTLDALESLDWASPTDLSTVVAAEPGAVTLTSRPESDARLDLLTDVVDAEHDLTDFSTALTTPTDLTEGTRLRTLALASNGWRADQSGFDAAVSAQGKRADRITNSVGIVDSSNINLFADRSSLPISVRNKSAYPVRVYLTITPSNSFLRVSKNRLDVTVQPDSQSRITFPVQSVANGKVELKMTLTSAANVPISTPSTVEINVQAQWESIITAVAAAAVVLIFGLGILRNIRRRIRRRRDGEPDDDEVDPNTPLDELPDDDARSGGATLVPGAATALAAAGSPGAIAVAPEVTDAPEVPGPSQVPSASQVPDTPGVADAPGAPQRAAGDGDLLEDAIARAGRAPRLQSGDLPTAATPQQPDVDASPVAERGLGRASALLAAGTMVSRVLGFVKTFVLAAAIGQSGSAAANAFAVSNQLPNSVYTLIAGGLLSAALIPQIVRATKHPDGGQRYIDKIVTIGVVVFLAVTVLATIGAPLLVGLYSQSAGGGGKGFSEATTALAVAFAFWCLPQILFYALYSLLGEVLNARQVFGPFTWAPLLNNVIAISGLVVFIALFGTRSENSDPMDWTPTKIAVLAGTATLGVAVQAGFLVLFWRRAGLTYRPDFRWRGAGLRTTGTAAGWLFLMILVTQLAGVVQSRVTSLGTGAANATLQNAWLLFMLPHSIITVSIATAYFTRMSHDAERGDLGAVRRNLSLSLRIVGLFTVFASVALMVVAFPFARLYEHAFGDVRAMAEVLLAYMPGLVLFSMLFVIQRAFWAMHDHRTPFLMQLVQSVLFVIGAVAVATLPGSYIGLGVAGVTTLAGCTQTVVALVVVRRRLGGVEGSVVTRSHVQFVIAAVIAGVAGLVVANFFGAFQASGFAMTDITSAGITVVLTGAIMAIVYFTALVVAKNAEIRSAVELLRARIGR